MVDPVRAGRPAATVEPVAAPRTGMSGRQLGLFGNPVSAFRLEELVETVRELERAQPGQTVAELSAGVAAELGIQRSRRAGELIAEAIRLARPARAPQPEIAPTRWQAGTAEVREWAAARGFPAGPGGGVPAAAISAWNQAHPDRPY